MPGNEGAIRAIILYCDLLVGAVLDGIQAEMTSAGADVGESETAPMEHLPEAKPAEAKATTEKPEKAEADPEKPVQPQAGPREPAEANTPAQTPPQPRSTPDAPRSTTPGTRAAPNPRRRGPAERLYIGRRRVFAQERQRVPTGV